MYIYNWLLVICPMCLLHFCLCQPVCGLLARRPALLAVLFCQLFQPFLRCLWFGSSAGRAAATACNGSQEAPPGRGYVMLSHLSPSLSPSLSLSISLSLFSLHLPLFPLSRLPIRPKSRAWERRLQLTKNRRHVACHMLCNLSPSYSYFFSSSTTLSNDHRRSRSSRVEVKQRATGNNRRQVRCVSLSFCLIDFHFSWQFFRVIRFPNGFPSLLFLFPFQNVVQNHKFASTFFSFLHFFVYTSFTILTLVKPLTLQFLHTTKMLRLFLRFSAYSAHLK